MGILREYHQEGFDIGTPVCLCALIVALKRLWVSLSFSGHKGRSSVSVYVCVSELSDPIVSGRCSGAELQ